MLTVIVQLCNIEAALVMIIFPTSYEAHMLLSVTYVAVFTRISFAGVLASPGGTNRREEGEKNVFVKLYGTLSSLPSKRASVDTNF